MSPPHLAFVHTAPVHVATFTALAAEIAPDVPLRHVVAAHLLEQAVREGGVSAALEEQVRRELLAVAAGGAAAICCTCSTLGPSAEKAGRHTSTPILRLDRAMAEKAVASGRRILVAACLESTLAPTTELVAAVARENGREAEIDVLFLPAAWALFERGDTEAYLDAIAAALAPQSGSADVIVLAQASMAGAAARCACDIPVLSSPRLGVEAAARAFRTRVAAGGAV